MKNLLLIPILFFMLVLGSNAQNPVLELNIKGSVGFQQNPTSPITYIPDYEVMFSDIFSLVPFVTDSTGHFEFTYEFPLGTEKEVTVSILDLCTGQIIEKKFKSTEQDVTADFLVCHDIVIPPDTEICMAYFGHQNGQEPFSVQFTDLSYGEDINSWKWKFGDGTTSSEQHPYHIYSSNGTYEVTLAIETDNCDHIIERLIQVTDDCNCPDVWDPVCIATPSGGFLTFGNKCEALCQGYTPNVFVSCETDSTECFVNIQFIQDPQNIQNFKFYAELDFYGQNSPLTEIDYSWDFGDGTTSTEGSVVGHEYTQNGTYNVTLLVETENASCRSEIQIIVDDCVCPDIHQPVCVLNLAGEIISFDNSCLALCAGYTPNQFVSCEQNECFATIQISPSPTDDLLSVQIAALLVTQPATLSPYYSWDFGDGTTESGNIPTIVHTYPSQGEYVIKLRVDLGQNVICETKIDVSIPFDGGCVCPDIYAPVCVLNLAGESITYNNFCEAQCDGYTQNDLISCDSIFCN